MTAQERLAAAHDRWMSDFSLPSLFVDALLDGIDPTLAQDIEDGAELRLAAAGQGTWTISNVRTAGGTVGYVAEAWSHSTGRVIKVLGSDGEDAMPPPFPTIAAAARACREALEARKGPEGGA